MRLLEQARPGRVGADQGDHLRWREQGAFGKQKKVLKSFQVKPQRVLNLMIPGDNGAPGGEHSNPERDVHRKKAGHRGFRKNLLKELLLRFSLFYQEVHLDFLAGYRTAIS